MCVATNTFVGRQKDVRKTEVLCVTSSYVDIVSAYFLYKTQIRLMLLNTTMC